MPSVGAPDENVINLIYWKSFVGFVSILSGCLVTDFGIRTFDYFIVNNVNVDSF